MTVVTSGPKGAAASIVIPDDDDDDDDAREASVVHLVTELRYLLATSVNSESIPLEEGQEQEQVVSPHRLLQLEFKPHLCRCRSYLEPYPVNGAAAVSVCVCSLLSTGVAVGMS